jgi:hypothetical protein
MYRTYGYQWLFGGNGVSLLQGQSSRGVKVTIQSHLVPGLRLGGAVPLLVCASLARRGQIYRYLSKKYVLK